MRHGVARAARRLGYPWRGRVRHRAEAGVTLVELLVALTVLALGLGVVAMLATAVLGAFESEPAAADAQQRARSGLYALIDDVQRAGSGFVEATDDAPGVALPALLPALVSTGAWPVAATPDILTAWHARRDASHGRLIVAAVAGDAVLRLARPAFCSAVSAACGFEPGDDVVIYSGQGRFAVAAVRQVLPPLDLVLTAPLSDAWPQGSVVSAVTMHGYQLRADPATGLSQLVRRLGTGPANPVVDFVTRFEVEWWIDGGVPQVRVAPGGLEEHASAGPAPPALGVVDSPSWPAGENCAFIRTASGAAAWRAFAGGPTPSVAPVSALRDGPWCPTPVAPTRWDVDLARVAEVRLVLGVAVATARLRPALGLGLTRAGARPVPDLVIETTVRPGRRGAGG